MQKQLAAVLLILALSVVWIGPSAAQPVAERNLTKGPSNFKRALDGDPSLSWNTFLGGTAADHGYAVAMDGQGSLFVAGTSSGAWGSPVRPYGGSEDAFVAKLNSYGELVWNTFLGSATGIDEAHAIAVDRSGYVIVAGQSLYTWGSPLNGHSADGSDIFVARLNGNGVLQWNTFHGGQSIDVGHGLAVDGTGNIYVTGESHGTWGTPVNPPGTGLINQEAFAARLSPSGALQWNTFMGDRNGDDFAKGIATNGALIVAGYSQNSWGAPVRPHSGDFYGDAFVAQLDSSTGVRQWNTFLGGPGTDHAEDIALDSGGSYLTGFSDATWSAPINPFPGSGENAFVARLNGNGALLWNTFLGSDGYDEDRGQTIALASAGRVFIGGVSDDTWGTPVHSHAGGTDAFVAQLNTSGALQWNTFLGGEYEDNGWVLTADRANVYTVGGSWVEYGDWGTPVRPASKKYDAFAARLTVPAPPVHDVWLPMVTHNW